MRQALAAARRLAGLLVPHGLVVERHARARRRLRAHTAELLAAASQPVAQRFAHDEAIAFLVRRGVDEDAALLGSIDGPSLAFVRDTIAARFEAGSPLRGLHIGNFLGVSLAAFSDALREVDPGSVTVSIDPDAPHLGVERTQQHTLALLARFGLQDANVIVPGYTLGALDDAGGHSACENVLPSLERLGVRFDAALLDGCHVGAYAGRETEVLARILRPGALLFLDDVTPHWEEIEELFHTAAAGPSFERLHHRGRIGVLIRAGGD